MEMEAEISLNIQKLGKYDDRTTGYITLSAKNKEIRLEISDPDWVTETFILDPEEDLDSLLSALQTLKAIALKQRRSEH